MDRTSHWGQPCFRPTHTGNKPDLLAVMRTRLLLKSYSDWTALTRDPLTLSTLGLHSTRRLKGQSLTSSPNPQNCLPMPLTLSQVHFFPPPRWHSMSLQPKAISEALKMPHCTRPLNFPLWVVSSQEVTLMPLVHAEPSWAHRATSTASMRLHASLNLGQMLSLLVY